MKKVCLLFLLIFVLIISFVGCVSDPIEYSPSEFNQSVKKDSIDKHISLWNKNGSYIQPNDTFFRNFSLSLDVEEMEHSIDIELISKEYKCKTLSANVVAVGNNNDEEVGIITISANAEKLLQKDRVEKYTNFTVKDLDKWNCYKITLENNEDIFIFETVCDNSKSGYLLEISGTNIEELQKIIDDIKITSALSYNPDAIFGWGVSYE